MPDTNVPATGLPRLTPDALQSLRSPDQRQTTSPVLCSAVYRFRPHALPFVNAMSRKFLEWCVPEFRFRTLPELVAQLDDFEKLSAGMKAVKMPDEFELKGGEYHEGDKVFAFTHLALTEDSCGVKLYDATATCEKVLQQVVCKLGEISDRPKVWKHYEPQVMERHYNTITRHDSPKNLTELLIPEFQAFLRDNLRRHASVLIARGASDFDAQEADVDVTVHPYSFRFKVHFYHRPSANQVSMDLELDHQMRADHPARIIRVESDLDYETHSAMVRDMLTIFKAKKQASS